MFANGMSQGVQAETKHNQRRGRRANGFTAVEGGLKGSTMGGNVPDTYHSFELDKLLYWPLHKTPSLFSQLVVPEWLGKANWIGGYDARHSSLGDTFKMKLQLVHAHGWKELHRDNNATDTYMKPLVGTVLVAVWSQARLHNCLRMPSHALAFP